AYSDTFSGDRNLPRASVSLTRRILESGVFNSCVTAETKSDFIDATIAAERAARAVRSNATIAAAAAIEISMKVRRAPRAAARMDSSGAACVRAVQYRIGKASTGAVARRTGSKNISGNFRSRSDAGSFATFNAVRFEVMGEPFSSRTSRTMLPRPSTTRV